MNEESPPSLLTGSGKNGISVAVRELGLSPPNKGKLKVLGGRGRGRGVR